MTSARHLLALGGILLAGLLLPATASAALTYGAVPSGTVGTTAAFTVTGSSSPVTSIWVEVDGVPGARADGPLTWPVTLTQDTATLSEGRHAFSLVADGVVERTVFLTVDRTPPAAPVPVTPLQLATTNPALTLRWSLPAGEPARRTTVKSMTVCDAAGCRAHVPGRLLWLALGTTTVRVVLADEAGNSSDANGTTWTITRTRAPRVDPGLRIASAAVRADRRTISVTGTLRVPHTNRVSVSVRARFGNRTRTVRTVAVTHGHDFRAHLVLPSSRWRTATVTARVAGSTRYLTVEKRKTVRRPGLQRRKV